MRAAKLLCACTLLAGCADNQETLIVLMAPAWEQGECTVDPSSDDALLFGVLDLRFRTPYLMPALLLNNSGEQQANDNNTGVVSNEIQLIDAEVTIDSPQAPDIIEGIDKKLLHFTAPLSTNSIRPSEVIGIAVEVLPQGTVNQLADAFVGQPPGAKVTVRANVVFNGTRTGNDVGSVGRVKARDFSFPIQLCDGCLVYCGGCDGDVGCPIDSSGVQGGVCGNAQDALVWPVECMPPSQ